MQTGETVSVTLLGHGLSTDIAEQGDKGPVRIAKSLTQPQPERGQAVVPSTQRTTRSETGDRPGAALQERWRTSAPAATVSVRSLGRGRARAPCSTIDSAFIRYRGVTAPGRVKSPESTA